MKTSTALRMIRATPVVLMSAVAATYASDRYGRWRKSNERKNRKTNPVVFMDIESDDGMEMGRLVCEIRADKVPKTAENFRQLCTHERGFGYRESVLFRILPNFGIQGGDITEDSGMGGRSVYGRYFEDESFELKHEYGSVTMANSGPNTNNSQFLIVTNENGASWLDEKHVVFGKVIEGEDVLKRIELYGTETGLPSKRIIVVDSGELEENEAERILRTCELKK